MMLIEEKPCLASKKKKKKFGIDSGDLTLWSTESHAKVHYYKIMIIKYIL